MRVLTGGQVNAVMRWSHVLEAMRAGHLRPQPELGDTLLQRGGQTMLVRSAWIDGMGQAVKAVTIYPANPETVPALPAIQGQVMVFDDVSGQTEALIDAVSVTAWKTAGDSGLGSSLLSRPDSASLLMVGAGAMAEPLIRAHVAVRPSIRSIAIWNRSGSRAEALRDRLADLGRTVDVVTDLAAAVGAADIVTVATMATEPVVLGRWLKPGTHLDLVGAYRSDMHEVDGEAVRRAKVWVDYRGTAIDHIGDLATPLRQGLITRDHILGDLYDLVPRGGGRQSESEITLYENGGGAHLDLMTCRAILDAVAASGKQSSATMVAAVAIGAAVS
jgi:ornithine cyclodeaminase/alanine dehydrogenase-like protein (mu-crystallin family)